MRSVDLAEPANGIAAPAKPVAPLAHDAGNGCIVRTVHSCQKVAGTENRMRLAEYSWVFDGWQPAGVVLLGTGYCQCLHLGLPYIEFHAVTNAGAVSVRCDLCSLDQDRTAYAAMVRADLELAMAKHERTGGAYPRIQLSTNHV